MPLLRRLGLLAVAAAGCAALSSPALAARNGGLPFTLDTPHFRVHYQSDITTAYAATQTDAGDIAARAERALTAETADGYAQPVSDGALGGDGRIDIYIDDLTASTGVLAFTTPDGNGATSSGYIRLAGNMHAAAYTQHVIAHELFHLIQFSMWVPPALSDAWLLEAGAEWMGFRVDGYSTISALGPPDMSLDCRDAVGTNQCDLTQSYLNNGYSRWTFFEYLAEKYGASVQTGIYSQGLAGSPTAVAALSAALVAKGTTLADAYNEWTKDELTSSYSVAALQAAKPRPYGAPIYTGAASGAVSAQKVAVNHLSTRYLQFSRGTATGTVASPCWQATLSLDVTIPAGSLSQPVFYWDGGGSSAVALAINGSHATATIPWDTCTWTTGEGFLALPNASQGVDGADFIVNASTVVDLKTSVTSIRPAAPPPSVNVTSPVVSVSSADVAPTVDVFGPQLLMLSASDQQIRLIVNASGQGLLSASLGSLALGTVSLRGGNNDVRFSVPAGTLAAVRRSASPSNVLTLTPTSASGAAVGTSVTRAVSIQPAKATKTAPPKKTHPKRKSSKK